MTDLGGSGYECSSLLLFLSLGRERRAKSPSITHKVVNNTTTDIFFFSDKIVTIGDPLIRGRE